MGAIKGKVIRGKRGIEEQRVLAKTEVKIEIINQFLNIFCNLLKFYSNISLSLQIFLSLSSKFSLNFTNFLKIFSIFKQIFTKFSFKNFQIA